MEHHITTVRLEDPLWKLLQQTSVKENRSVTTVVTRAVQKYLKVSYKETEGNRPTKRDGRSTRHEGKSAKGVKPVTKRTKKTARS